jgi:hypothetical protein
MFLPEPVPVLTAQTTMALPGQMLAAVIPYVLHLLVQIYLPERVPV